MPLSLHREDPRTGFSGTWPAADHSVAPQALRGGCACFWCYVPDSGLAVSPPHQWAPQADYLAPHRDTHALRLGVPLVPTVEKVPGLSLRITWTRPRTPWGLLSHSWEVAWGHRGLDTAGSARGGLGLEQVPSHGRTSCCQAGELLVKPRRPSSLRGPRGRGAHAVTHPGLPTAPSGHGVTRWAWVQDNATNQGSARKQLPPR